MASFISKLRKDRRGNVLAITAAALPLVVGSAGLATDTIQWASWKRQLQRAADSAAFAGVYAKAQSGSASDAVNSDLAKKLNNAGINVLGGYPQIAYPTSASWTNSVQVTLATQRKLAFSSLFMSAAPIIKTTATAAMVDDGIYCVVALENGTAPGLTIGGSSNSTLGCGAISNSISGTASASTNGNSYTFNATEVAGAGGLPSAITGTAKLSPYHFPLPDPFAGKYSTDIPASALPCKNFQQMTYGQDKVKAGCFNSFKLTGNTVYKLDPGVYYLNSTDFDVAGGAGVTGDGVTIILTGSTPGSIKTNGNSNIQLSAPTSGPYEKMLFIQSPNATVDNLNEINGNNTAKYDGAMYFPKGQITFTGSSGAMTKCAMVVGKKVDFSGSSNLQNDVVGCKANKTVTGKKIRLVG